VSSVSCRDTVATMLRVVVGMFTARWRFKRSLLSYYMTLKAGEVVVDLYVKVDVARAAVILRQMLLYTDM
jgi:hypothetical protein